MIKRFLHFSFGYWRGGTRRIALFLTSGFILSLVINVVMALVVNRWSKEFFDALQVHRMDAIVGSVEQLIVLAVATAIAAIATVQFRMNLQVSWRMWLMSDLVKRWINSITALSGAANLIDNPEARIADDGRIAIELFVELAGGIAYTVMISVSFIVVLWQVGGSTEIFGFTLHGYLVFAVILYTSVTSLSVFILGYPLIRRVEEKSQAEGNFRYILTETRYRFDMPSEDASNGSKRQSLEILFQDLAGKWLHVIRGQTKIISFSSANNLIAPAIPVLLCAPKYLTGDMSLGDIMQAAAAFLQVQTSLNWLADNAFNLANWSASARRVAALDEMIGGGSEPDIAAGTVQRMPQNQEDSCLG